jgi:hypothetical protein
MMLCWLVQGDEHLRGACCFHLQGSSRRASCAVKCIICSVKAKWVVGLLHSAGHVHQSAKAFSAYSKETIQSNWIEWFSVAILFHVQLLSGDLSANNNIRWLFTLQQRQSVVVKEWNWPFPCMCIIFHRISISHLLQVLFFITYC